ncbi:Hypothetical predicted protein [Mytilus galloprovincialis]|uniref:Uncharacterized protein n=1 Tax=Mytilus galloprovincialis TaxID=29158 RepID=A0A8B6EQ97_MYTGA|nr:Hypothetical predicted protein [Mytilus galloprovincialis]
MAPLLEEQMTADKPPFTFVGVDYFGPLNVKLGRHRGGAWEGMIRSTKNIFKPLINQQLLSDEQLLPFMAETERIMNDRPITAISDDCRDLPVLTPNMPSLMKSNTSTPQAHSSYRTKSKLTSYRLKKQGLTRTYRDSSKRTQYRSNKSRIRYSNRYSSKQTSRRSRYRSTKPAIKRRYPASVINTSYRRKKLVAKKKYRKTCYRSNKPERKQKIRTPEITQTNSAPLKNRPKEPEPKQTIPDTEKQSFSDAKDRPADAAGPAEAAGQQGPARLNGPSEAAGQQGPARLNGPAEAAGMYEFSFVHIIYRAKA